MVNCFHLFLGKLLSSFIFEGMFLLFSSSLRASRKYVQLFKSIYEIEFIFWLLFPVAVTVGPFRLVQFMVANRNGPNKMCAYKKVDTTEGYKVQSSYSGDDKPLSIQIKCINWISDLSLLLFGSVIAFIFFKLFRVSFLGLLTFLILYFLIYSFLYFTYSFICFSYVFVSFLSFYFHFVFVCNSRPFRTASCLASQFRCTTSGFCIPSVQKCDGIVDCPDREDEIDCATPPPPGFIIYFCFRMLCAFSCSLFVIRLTCFSRDLIVKSMPN